MSFMPHTIAGAIANSNCQFTFCYPEQIIDHMQKTSDPHVEKLRKLVEIAGGPAEFARKYSQDGADKPIDATYVSQLLNGHRAFRDKARQNMARRAGLDIDYFEIRNQAAKTTAVYNFWPALIIQIAEIARDLPEHMQHQLLGQAKMLQTEWRVSANPGERVGQ